MSHQSLIHSVQVSDLKGALSRNPHNIKTWWKYIQLLRADEKSLEGWGVTSDPDIAALLVARGKAIAGRVPVYECALQHLPGSYKLWFAYLSELSAHASACAEASGDVSTFTTINKVYERALQYMHKYPRMWSDYCAVLIRQGLVTRTRKTFDRALQALPVTQHAKVWKQYSAFVRGSEEEGLQLPPFIVANVYHRYCQFDATKREELVHYLLDGGHHDEAARQLAVLVDDSQVRSARELWSTLRNLAARHGDKITSVDLEKVLKTGIHRFPEEAGEMWCSIAEMHTRNGNFAGARDAYDEGIETVGMVRSFGVVYDRYTRFEEALTKAKVNLMESILLEEEEDEEEHASASTKQAEAERDVDLCMERLDALLSRRALSLNAVKLRQDEHDVEAWNERVEILKTYMEGKKRRDEGMNETEVVVDGGDADTMMLVGQETTEEDPVATCFRRAVSTILPHRVTSGSLVQLWMDYAAHHASKEREMNVAEKIMKQASEVVFMRKSECAKARCAWAEMRLEHEDFEGALALMKDAVRARSSSSSSSSTSSTSSTTPKLPAEMSRKIQQRLLYSPAVWNMYIDLEESIGTLDTTRAAYDRMIVLKVASAQTILNYAELMSEHQYYEESFKIYEKGIEMFVSSKQNYEIWLAYLNNFVQRYGASKLERARELFDQCLSTLGSDTPNSKAVFLQYAGMEEEHGLTRRAMAVYERAVKFVPIEDMYDIFCIYLQKTEEYFGVVATRPVYEKALSVVPDADVRNISLRFAEMERQLGELDRARAIFVHGSQTCDPKRFRLYWDKWKEFELKHGNEVTFKDMLQIKRTIGARFSAATYSVQEEEAKAKKAAEAAVAAEEAAKDFAKQQRDGDSGNNTSDVAALGKRKAPEDDIREDAAKRAKEAAAVAAAAIAAEEDDDEIDLDDDEEDGDDGDQRVGVIQRPVPSSVFGAAAAVK